jgi:acetolactate synthase-1/2/3 large subunit
MGTMGYSIPAALGAKVGNPKKQVVCVCGDGSFQMSMMELATIKQYDINIKIIVFKNNFLGLVRQYQHFNYKDKYSVTELEGTPDLEKLASAYDINFIKVTKNDQIDDAIDKFLKKDEAYLMEVDIDPMDLV